MTDIINKPAQAPYLSGDSTRNWVEQYRKNGLIKPQVHLRVATDTNYIKNERRAIYPDPYKYQTKAVMNVASPGMRIPGITSWQVNESLDQVVSTAQIECLNCLPISTTQTTLVGSLDHEYYTPTITASYATGSLFVVEKVPHSNSVELYTDSQGYTFREENVKYRTFADTTFTIANAIGFPDPAIPKDDDNDIGDDTYWNASPTGIGAYYVLIGDEVVRVIRKSGNIFHIPPGGRAVNGVLRTHSPGETVSLLGFGPFTGDWTAMGYLNIDDYNPQKAILRPGTALTSYEGYGDISGLLSHDYDRTRNYAFTGYWFVKGAESSLGEDGVPRIRVDLVGPGQMYDQQKITPDILRRMKTQFGQWKIGGSNIFAAAGHTRDIPGDWVDFNEWDPNSREAYPMEIKVELAQHKEFFNHMNESEKGLRCELCQGERKEWLKNHENPNDLRNTYNAMPAGPAKDAVGQRVENLELQQARAIGRHIYKKSIRVLRTEAGPIKTYIRLMATMAAAAWDHPALGVDLGQKFTKIPSKLFDNIRNVHTGLIYNGQVDFELKSSNPQYDWAYPTYSDNSIVGKRRALSAPFESTYDKAPFSQPMADLAAVNDATFYVDRRGYPIFSPRTFNKRPSGKGFKDLDRTTTLPKENDEWFMAYGASIKSYSHSINPDSVFTQVWITAESAFEGSNITIAAGGTGFTSAGRVLYSGLGGNKQGLALTSGVQQVETQTLDNQILGFDWNTNTAEWGIIQEIENKDIVLNAVPPLYDGSPVLNTSTKGNKNGTTRVQKIVNFFLIRRYLPVIVSGSKSYYVIPEDGKYGLITKDGVIALQQYLIAQMPVDERPTSLITADGVYGRDTYLWVKKYLDIAKHFIKFDVWWYVQNDRTWEEYIAAITGVPIPFKPNSKATNLSKGSSKAQSPDQSQYLIYDKGKNEEVEKWLKSFSRMLINAGNRVIDDSINKATARSISSDYADPRIVPGDTIWCEIPGFLGSRDEHGRRKAPFTNGIYLTTISRTMDLTQGTYSATYTGFRAVGEFGQGLSRGINNGWDFLT